MMNLSKFRNFFYVGLIGFSLFGVRAAYSCSGSIPDCYWINANPLVLNYTTQPVEIYMDSSRPGYGTHDPYAATVPANSTTQTDTPKTIMTTGWPGIIGSPDDMHGMAEVIVGPDDMVSQAEAVAYQVWGMYWSADNDANQNNVNFFNLPTTDLTQASCEYFINLDEDCQTVFTLYPLPGVVGSKFAGALPFSNAATLTAYAKNNSFIGILPTGYQSNLMVGNNFYGAWYLITMAQGVANPSTNNQTPGGDQRYNFGGDIFQAEDAQGGTWHIEDLEDHNNAEKESPGDHNYHFANAYGVWVVTCQNLTGVSNDSPSQCPWIGPQ